MGSYESLKHAHVFIDSLREVNAQRLSVEHAKYRSDLWTLVQNAPAATGLFAPQPPAAGLAASLAIDGEPVDIRTGKLLSLDRRLDLHSGIAWTDVHWVSPRGVELKVAERSFHDRAHRGRTFHQYEIEPLSGPVAVAVGAAIAGAAAPQAQGSAIAAASGGKTVGVSLTIKDRPQAQHLVARGEVRSQTQAEKDKVLCIEVCEVRPCLASAALGDCLAADALAAVIKAGAEGFAQARIASAAACRESWLNSPAADLAARAKAFATVENSLGY